MDEFDFDGYMDGLEESGAEIENPLQETVGTISQIADAYQAARDRKDRAEAELKAAKKQESDLRQMLIEAMLEDETDSIGRNGRKYTVVSKTKYSKKAGADAELFTLLRENGMGDLVQETVNAATLSAAMNQMCEGDPDNLGEEWQECLNVYTYTDISVRKG